MEIKKARELLERLLRDRRFVWAAVLLGMAGVVLIYLSSWGAPPDGEERGQAQPEEALCAGEYRQRLEEDLRRVVRAVTGEDSPEVMVTLENAGSLVYAADENESSSSDGAQRESTHVVLEDSSGAQHGLALKELQPEVKGVVIVSRRAGDPAVRERLVNAARTVLGVPSSRVCVVESVLNS